MPRQYSDSGYEGSNQNINMTRQDPNIIQSFSGNHGDAFNYYIPGDFPLSEYRDGAQSSVTGLDSLPGESFHSPVGLLPMDDHIDPGTAGSAALAGLDGPLDHFTLNGGQPEQDLTRNAAFQGFQPDHSALSFPPEDGSSGPWNSLAVDEAMNKRSYPPEPQSPCGPVNKRPRQLDSDPGYGSQQQYSQYNTSPSWPTPSRSEHARGKFNNNPSSSQIQNQELFAFQAGLRDQHHEFKSPYNQATLQSPLEPSERGQQPQATAKSGRTRKLDKKHRCDLCPDFHKVFGTPNDLARHKRTVHRQLKPKEKIWICKVRDCNSGNKIWPRLDNFKQHVERMHKGLNLDSAESMEEAYDPTRHGEMEVVVKSRNRISESGSLAAGASTSLMPTSHSGVNAFFPPVTSTRAAFGGTPSVLSQRATAQAGGRGSPLQSSLQNGPGSMSSASGSPNSDAEHLVNLQLQTGLLSPIFRPSSMINRAYGVRRNGPTDAITVADPTCQPERAQFIHERGTIPFSSDMSHTFSQDLASVTGSFEPGFSTSASTNYVMNASTGAQYDDATERLDLVDMHESDIDIQIRAGLNHVPQDCKPQILQFVQKLSASASSSSSQPGQRSDKSLLSTKSKTDVEKAPKNHRCEEIHATDGKKVVCGRLFASRSELKKHHNRYLRRYGCTFDHCYRRFGTKWEWKRHERNQHVQLESWRCRQHDKCDPQKLCAQLFQGDKEGFVKHLSQLHYIRSAEEQKLEISECKLAKKWLGSFWCGFCVKIIKLPPRMPFGIEMDNARMSHVSDHIDGNNVPSKDMRDWVELGGQGLTKREMREREREGSLRPAPAEGEIKEDDSDSPDSEEDQETEVERPSKPQRPRITTVHGSSAQSHEQKFRDGSHRLSATSTPTFRLYISDNEVVEPSSSERPSQLAQREVFHEHRAEPTPQPMSACGTCMNPVSFCTCGFPENETQTSQGEDFVPEAFQDSMIYDTPYSPFE